MGDYAYYAAKGFTQSETAKAMGVSRAAVSDYSKRYRIKFVKHKQRGIEYNGYESYSAAARAEGKTEAAIWNRVNIPRKYKGVLPKIKELEWVDASWKKNPEEKTINGCVEYRAYFRKGKLWGAYGSYSGSRGVYEIGQEFGSIEEAKAAAQTHFEKLILDQIEV